MSTEYVVWIFIEECEVDGEDCDGIAEVGEPRQAGRFQSERSAYEHVERLLEHARAVGAS